MDLGIANGGQRYRLARTKNRTGGFEKDAELQHPGFIRTSGVHLIDVGSVVGGRGHDLLRPEDRSVQPDLGEWHSLTLRRFGLDAWPDLIKVVAHAEPPVRSIAVIPVGEGRRHVNDLFILEDSQAVAMKKC